jgi:hypothetical protein
MDTCRFAHQARQLNRPCSMPSAALMILVSHPLLPDDLRRSIPRRDSAGKLGNAKRDSVSGAEKVGGRTGRAASSPVPVVDWRSGPKIAGVELQGTDRHCSECRKFGIKKELANESFPRAPSRNFPHSFTSHAPRTPQQHARKVTASGVALSLTMNRATRVASRIGQSQLAGST